MDSSSRAEIKVGATVLIALIIFIGGLLWLKGFRLDKDNYVQAVWFPNIGTLTVGEQALNALASASITTTAETPRNTLLVSTLSLISLVMTVRTMLSS